MRLVPVLLILVLSCVLVIPLYSHDVERSPFSVGFTEFGYPLAFSTSQLDLQIPVTIKHGAEHATELNIAIWYRAASPFLVPNTFFEVGIVPSVNVLKPGKSKLFLGVGTAYSQSISTTSIPVIVPIAYTVSPTYVLDLNISIQNMLYGEGFLSEVILSTRLHFPHLPLSIEVGGSGNVAYSWKNQAWHYSYGLLVGVRYDI